MKHLMEGSSAWNKVGFSLPCSICWRCCSGRVWCTCSPGANSASFSAGFGEGMEMRGRWQRLSRALCVSIARKAPGKRQGVQVAVRSHHEYISMVQLAKKERASQTRRICRRRSCTRRKGRQNDIKKEEKTALVKSEARKGEERHSTFPPRSNKELGF